MAEYKYNFEKLIQFLETEFVYPSDCVEVLETIENTLINLDQIIKLQPEVGKSIKYLESLKLALKDSIPNDKKRV